MLGPPVPFGACTATATPEKLQLIRAGLGIKDDAVSILEPLNRHNLFYSVREIKGPENGEEDLAFLIPRQDIDGGGAKPDISPTILYVDSIPLAMLVGNQLRRRLPPRTHIRPPRPKEWDGDPR